MNKEIQCTTFIPNQKPRVIMPRLGFHNVRQCLFWFSSNPNILCSLHIHPLKEEKEERVNKKKNLILFCLVCPNLNCAICFSFSLQPFCLFHSTPPIIYSPIKKKIKKKRFCLFLGIYPTSATSDIFLHMKLKKRKEKENKLHTDTFICIVW